MAKINYVKQTECPRCHTKHLLIFGLDQMCSECDWDNLKLLVDLGQMDDAEVAAFEHFQMSYPSSSENQEPAINLKDSLTA